MTDEREAKLARLLQDDYWELRTPHPLVTARVVLAAIDADPEAYGYRKWEKWQVIHDFNDDGYCRVHEGYE